MKKLIFLFAINFVAIAAWSQGSAGLIAHWDMNGTVNDVSGNGNNGTAHNITAAVGESGAPNTAWYFNGVNSYISVPYAPALNVTQYSICAKVNVMGFYTGNCQGNIILLRGSWASAGCYAMSFDDQPYAGGCSVVDTPQEVFVTIGGANSATPILWQYTPNIIENTWYKVVVTFDGTIYKVYVNGTLKSTNSCGGIPIASTTDSLSIGMDIYDAALGYPYNFKGIIDDIRFYNRSLSDTEVSQYGDSCGTIIRQPSNYLINAGSNAVFTVSTTITSPNYQWQEDAGLGFVNLTNSGPYSGVYTDSLKITGVTTAMNDFHFRCFVYNDAACTDTSAFGILTTTTGINNITSIKNTTIYPNPIDEFINIKFPMNTSNGYLQLINDVGQIVSERYFSGEKVIWHLETLPPGIYTVKISLEGQIIYKKVCKY